MLRKIMVVGAVGLSLLLTGCAHSNPVPGSTVRAIVAVQNNAPKDNYEIRVFDSKGFTRFDIKLGAGQQSAASVPASNSYRFELDTYTTAAASQKTTRAKVCTVTTTNQASSLRFTTDGTHCAVH